MANNVNIDTNSNKVNVLSSDNNITITKDTKVVNVTEEVNKVIEIITRGPQGPRGADGSGGGSDLNALTTASVSNSIITFTKGSGDQFNIRVDNVAYAQTASFVLADNIRQPFTSVEATSLTGSLDYSYIENVPDFVDTTGDIEVNQIAIFAETFDGIPESLPFSIPLENDGNPTIKGVSGLTFDGSLFKVQGVITGSNIPPNLINLQGNAAPNQLLKFVDTTDTELPIPLPFYVPVNDGNPTVSAVSGLAMVGDLLTLEGNISASGYISASTFYGDGSNLTGVGADPFPYTGNAVITGSLQLSVGTVQIDGVGILSNIANQSILGSATQPTIFNGSNISTTAALTSSFGFKGDVVGNLTGTATNANNVYVTHGSTTSTGWHLPMYRPTSDGSSYVDGNYPILNPINEILYYQRTTNPITGDTGASDYLQIGGGQNTAGGIRLNSTVTRNNFIYSNYETFYIHADGGSTGVLNLSADSQVKVTSKLNISSSLYIDGIVDVTNHTGSTYQVGITGHIIFNTFEGGSDSNNPAIIYLPLVAKSENRQIRFLTDSTLANNSKEVHIYPNASDTATIDGTTHYELERPYDGVMLMCHNSNWWVIQRKSK